MNYKDIKLIPLPEREVLIVGTITAEKMSVVREKALAKVKADLEIPGFRKGNAPDSIIVQKVGEMRILEEAAEIALSEEYPNILDEHKIEVIGRPEITITKIGLGAPLEFKAKTSLMPDVKLADFKKIAKEENSKEKGVLEVSEKEIEDVISNIRQNIANQAKSSQGDDRPAQAMPELREADDELAKTIGNFKDFRDMKEKIKENLLKEKELKKKDKRRVEILEEIMKNSTIDLPKIIIDGEMEKMLAQLKDDIAKAGSNYEDYLKHIKKTEEDLRKEWKDTAIKRAKSQIILNTIAREEGISPKEEDIKKEMDHILEHFKDANLSAEALAKVDRFRVRMYVETFLTNELVFQFLEKQK